MNKILILAIFNVVFLSAKISQHTLPNSTIKKIDKTLADIWPEQDVARTVLTISPTDAKKLSFNPSNNFYKITKNNNIVAYMCLSEANSKIMTFDYMLVFSPELSILKIKMLAYREEYGGEIGSKRWLTQFIGKKDPEQLKFGHDIQGISGATISARNMTNDVQKVMNQIIELKKVGLI